VMGKKNKYKTFREKVMDKIYSLPDEQRDSALSDFNVHEYFSSKENQHATLIKDRPHPLMVLDGDRYSRSGQWFMGGMDGRHDRPRQT
jgi:hypothetical protein